MGRATEGFDFLASEKDITQSEFNDRYGSIGDYESMKLVIRKFKKMVASSEDSNQKQLW